MKSHWVFLLVYFCNANYTLQRGYIVYGARVPQSTRWKFIKCFKPNWIEWKSIFAWIASNHNTYAWIHIYTRYTVFRRPDFRLRRWGRAKKHTADCMWQSWKDWEVNSTQRGKNVFVNNQVHELHHIEPCFEHEPSSTTTWRHAHNSAHCSQAAEAHPL